MKRLQMFPVSEIPGAVLQVRRPHPGRHDAAQGDGGAALPPGVLLLRRVQETHRQAVLLRRRQDRLPRLLRGE